ncbi:MAG: roadblock/LC7 domain-containing protein [Piscinibacter sp.]|nr:roadblock/LC7 domain-containing protein [Piscinibacter sp.]
MNTSTPTHPLSSQAEQAAGNLLSGVDGAQAVLVATVDGFSLAHAQRKSVDADRLAAIVSSIGALGAAASRETGIGEPRCLVVESTQGRLVVRCFSVGRHALIVAVLTDTSVLLGLVWSQLAQAERALASA